MDQFTIMPTVFRPVPIKIKLVNEDAAPLSKGKPDGQDFVHVMGNDFIFNLGFDVSVVADKDWATKNAFGLKLNKKDMFFKLYPKESKLFSTGIQVEAPLNYGFLIRDRSSLGIKDITVEAGVIEGSYRNEWKIQLINLGKDIHIFHIGDRIAQAILIPIIPATVSVVESLSKTKRGLKGFGSSNKFHHDS